MYHLPYTANWVRSVSARKYDTFLVFIASLAWLGGLAWMRPLSIPDEGRYVGVAWEMFRSGNWVTPTLDGLPFFHKPPLFYWITTAAMHLFSPNDWAARTAPILAGSATVAVLYSVCRGWLGEKPARMAAVVLATQPLFFGGSQFANMDMLVAACITAAILFGARAALCFEEGVDRRSALGGAYVAAALAVLAKGLIGLVIPALVLMLWLGLVRHWKTLRSILWLPGAAIFAVITFPWFVAAQWEHPGFFHYFFVVQHLQRFTGSGFNNVQPFWFYVPVLLVFTLPWSGWWFVNLRQSTRLRSTRPAVLSLMFVWLGVVLAFFSVPESKLVGYALPALAPLAVLAALMAEPLIQRSRTALTLWRGCIAVSCAICVATVVGFAIAHPKSSQALAMALRARHEAPGGLAFVDEYRYDVPFYLRDASPVLVVSNWDPAEVRRHDNWRKEIADAASFAPDLAASRLLDDPGFRTALCGGRVKWIVARLDAAKRYPFLNSTRRVATDRDSALWQIDASSEPWFASNCATVQPILGTGAL